MFSNAGTCLTIASAIACRVAGCTELHLLAPGYAGQTEFNERFEIVDPLTTLAKRIREQTNETTLRA